MRGGMAARGRSGVGRERCPLLKWTVQHQAGVSSPVLPLGSASAALRTSLFADPRATVLPGPESMWLQFEVAQIPNRRNWAQSLANMW